jgi:arylsulfatase A-like enzyme
VRLNGMDPLPESANTFTERLHAAGYHTAAVVSSVILDQSSGLSQGFDVYEDDMPPVLDGSAALSQLQRKGDEAADRALAFLDPAPPSPWLLWLHFYDPHLPYDPPARIRRLTPGRPYDGEVAFVDEQLGRVLARVDRAKTIVVVIGDHGESLGDHGEADHGFFIYDSTMHVPFIVAGPGVAPRVVTEQVRAIDVAPTIEALAGLTPAADLDGESLVPLLGGGSRADPPVSYAASWYPRLHFGWSELRSLRAGEWKYIAAPRPELYDLRVDPGERRNLAGEHRTARPGDDRAAARARLCGRLRAGHGWRVRRGSQGSPARVSAVSRAAQRRAGSARCRTARRGDHLARGDGTG